MGAETIRINEAIRARVAQLKNIDELALAVAALELWARAMNRGHLTEPKYDSPVRLAVEEREVK